MKFDHQNFFGRLKAFFRRFCYVYYEFLTKIVIFTIIGIQQNILIKKTKKI